MNFVEKIKILQNYYKSGNFEKVIQGCKTLNKKFPNNSFILNLFGRAVQGLNKHQKAIDLFESAITADSLNVAAMNNLANSLKHIEQFVESEKMYKKILDINPNYLYVYNNYANLKNILNDVEGAIELYKKAVDLAKKSKINPIGFLVHLATANHSLNKKKETLDVINEILEFDPDNVSAHKILSSIYKYSKEDKKTMSHLTEMESILRKNGLDENQKAAIAYAIGKAYDDLKDPKQAIKFISLGGQSYKKNNKSNINEEINMMREIINTFKDINLNKSNNFFSKKKIIFICGMPRSGTTLTEQIISSHKKVYGAGELTFLNNIIFNNFVDQNGLNKQKIIDYQNSMNNLVNDQYFEKLSLFNIEEQTITDKATINFKLIGFIKIFFPNSKIIYCKRNPQDNCLSIYKNYFQSMQMNWSHDEKDISNYYNNHNYIMNFWLSKIPDLIYIMKYEKIVSDRENEIKKILKFCDLEWDENCLSHHKNTKTSIKTASISQARQSVYSSSVNSHERYKPYLKEMFNNLI